jgi:hypothetical protein
MLSNPYTPHMLQAAYTVGGHSFNAATIEYCLLKSKSTATRPHIVRISNLIFAAQNCHYLKIQYCTRKNIHEFLASSCVLLLYDLEGRRIISKLVVEADREVN